MQGFEFGQRPGWDEYFLQLARLVASRSTCIRRQVGAVLVKKDRIIATGYNGAPRGLKHCLEVGCLREAMNIPSGHRYELCRGVHAEQNAIINAAYYGVSTEGAVLYCTNQPCIICARMIINAGITKVVHEGNFNDDLALELLNEAGIELVLYKPGQDS
ncbi:cytidine/deoxycytidylate deaminase family protein [Thermosyntropha sp.]|uniref:deoxycytidylate deaminase n=1 Tax=Thermosyntropha sp. TaxID=2740820 RepID=UPI0025CF0131|nr:cytidine/deoxycytidylate deaminase family protein [Thermosyntropha sp.]MBO8157972.1 cytidine/deoxycytidylate deaminase family protein [Thermosyntropha sp.]